MEHDTIDTGDPLYPMPKSMRGMTLLDYFAGQALGGYRGCSGAVGLDAKHMANLAYLDADAMIAEKRRREAK